MTVHLCSAQTVLCEISSVLIHSLKAFETHLYVLLDRCERSMHGHVICVCISIHIYSFLAHLYTCPYTIKQSSNEEESSRA